MAFRTRIGKLSMDHATAEAAKTHVLEAITSGKASIGLAENSYGSHIVIRGISRNGTVEIKETPKVGRIPLAH
ncbi:MAG: hypothetical protein H0X38_04220 [Planctomycetes bacterium]|nr:hypothetical protein [Planctomycetota bacterium]